MQYRDDYYLQGCRSRAVGSSENPRGLVVVVDGRWSRHPVRMCRLVSLGTKKTIVDLLVLPILGILSLPGVCSVVSKILLELGGVEDLSLIHFRDFCIMQKL